MTTGRWCCLTFLIVVMCQLFECKPVLYMEKDTYTHHITSHHITSSANINTHDCMWQPQVEKMFKYMYMYYFTLLPFMNYTQSHRYSEKNQPNMGFSNNDSPLAITSTYDQRYLSMTQLIWHVYLTFPRRLHTLAMPHVPIHKGARLPCATPVSLAKFSQGQAST